METGQRESEELALAGFVHETAEMEGVQRVALFDGAGRVVAAVGFADRDELSGAAALTTGLSAAGVRLGGLVRGMRTSRILLSGEADETQVHSVSVWTLGERKGIEARVLLLVATQEALDSLAPRLEEIAGSRGGAVGHEQGIPDPDGFERSLVDRMDRLFP